MLCLRDCENIWDCRTTLQSVWQNKSAVKVEIGKAIDTKSSEEMVQE